MRVYRLCSSAYVTLDGEGSRLYGGRWNSAGLPVVYTASSLALAMLETGVHLQRMPIDYVRLTIEIPDTVFDPKEVSAASLSVNWKSDTSVTRRIGDLHFGAFPMVPLKVPSVVVDTEWNLLFSRDFAAVHVEIVDNEPIAMDVRLWTV